MKNSRTGTAKTIQTLIHRIPLKTCLLHLILILLPVSRCSSPARLTEPGLIFRMQQEQTNAVVSLQTCRRCLTIKKLTWKFSVSFFGRPSLHVGSEPVTVSGLFEVVSLHFTSVSDGAPQGYSPGPLPFLHQHPLYQPGIMLIFN